MTQILSSTYTEGPTQIDGRRWVNELHTDDAGRTYPFDWLGVTDAKLTLTARAARLNAQLAAADAAQAQIAGTMLPISKLAFRELFTAAERQGIDAFNVTFESHPALTIEQKSALRTGLEDYKVADNIRRPFDVRVKQMVGMYVALGLVTTERMSQIVEAADGA